MTTGRRTWLVLVFGFALILLANTINDVDSRRDRTALHSQFVAHDRWAVKQRTDTAERVKSLERRVAELERIIRESSR